MQMAVIGRIPLEHPKAASLIRKTAYLCDSEAVKVHFSVFCKPYRARVSLIAPGNAASLTRRFRFLEAHVRHYALYKIHRFLTCRP